MAVVSGTPTDISLFFFGPINNCPAGSGCCPIPEFLDIAFSHIPVPLNFPSHCYPHSFGYSICTCSILGHSLCPQAASHEQLLTHCLVASVGGFAAPLPFDLAFVPIWPLLDIFRSLLPPPPFCFFFPFPLLPFPYFFFFLPAAPYGQCLSTPR